MDLRDSSTLALIADNKYVHCNFFFLISKNIFVAQALNEDFDKVFFLKAWTSKMKFFPIFGGFGAKNEFSSIFLGDMSPETNFYNPSQKSLKFFEGIFLWQSRFGASGAKKKTYFFVVVVLSIHINASLISEILIFCLFFCLFQWFYFYHFNFKISFCC